MTDSFDRTPAFYAISEGNYELFLELLPNIQDLNHQDSEGNCLLHFAVEYKNLNVVEELLKAGIDVHLSNNHGNAALWTATFNARGEYGIVQALVDAGAEAKQQNSAGRSPLDFAKQIGDENLIGILGSGEG